MRAGLPGIGIVSTMRGRCPSVVGWWNPFGDIPCVWGAWQAKGAGTFAASLLDLSGNGNNLGDPGGAATPAWAVGVGWTFDGVGNYLTTTFVPQNDQSQTYIVQFSNRTNAGCLVGHSQTANNRSGIFPQAGNVLYHNGTFGITLAPALFAGNLCVAGANGYRNGVVEAGAITAYGGVPTIAVWIGCLNNGGVPAQYIAVDVQAAVLYDCTLTAPQVLTVATAMAAL